MRLKHVKDADKVVEQGIYYVNNPKEYKGKWNKLFDNNNDIYIEIGMGKGDFIIENALKYPNINFIGIEMYDSVMIRAIQKSNELELNNLKLVKKDLTDKEICKELDIGFETLENIRHALSLSSVSMNQTVDDDEKNESIIENNVFSAINRYIRFLFNDLNGNLIISIVI